MTIPSSTSLLLSPSTVRWDGYSLKGSARETNEDRFQAGPWPPEPGSGGALLVVADGMGGHPAGEVASQIATRSLMRSLEDVDPRLSVRGLESQLRRAVTQAHRDILADEEGHAERQGMATTLTAALIHGSTVSVVHVGDSRAYRFRKGVLTPLTVDHTLDQVLRDSGVALREAAGGASLKHALWNYLGGQDNSPDPFISSGRVQKGDLILLATDGLTNVFRDADLAQVLSGGGTVKTVVRRLIRMARRRGSRDDATALLARISA